MPPMRPYSQLAFQDIRTGDLPAQATVIALHGHGGGHHDLIPLARSLHPRLRIVAPAAARSVYMGMEVIGQTWFGGSLVAPEPASFGDSLAQLERFVHDVRERAVAGEPTAPWLLGFDQGAVLALTLAGVAPDLVAGVMAVAGCLPTFSDPDLLELVTADLPILLIAEPGDGAVPAAAVEKTRARFAELGARVTVTWLPGVQALGPEGVAALRSWLAAQLGQ